MSFDSFTQYYVRVLVGSLQDGLQGAFQLLVFTVSCILLPSSNLLLNLGRWQHQGIDLQKTVTFILKSALSPSHTGFDEARCYVGDILAAEN